MICPAFPDRHKEVVGVIIDSTVAALAPICVTASPESPCSLVQEAMITMIPTNHQIGIYVVGGGLIEMMHTSSGRQMFTQGFLGYQNVFKNAAIGVCVRVSMSTYFDVALGMVSASPPLWILASAKSHIILPAFLGPSQVFRSLSAHSLQRKFPFSSKN
jgi:hypothetical protein